MAKASTAPVRVAFYTRISTDEDHQKYSLDAQKDRLEAYSTAQWGTDWQLHQIYRDTESGTHMQRPGLQAMLTDAEAKAFDVLLVFRVDRLSRKVHELARMVEDLTKQGVVLKSITEPFDTASAAGLMMLQMLGVFAQFEHSTIVERTKVGMAKKAQGGHWVGGHVPYGYQLDPDKRLVLQEDEALLVRKLFQWYALDHEGTHTICQKLNAAGSRKRSGKKWDKRMILFMLQSPLYIGKIRWHEVLYEGQHEPIVSEILFDKAQEILAKRSGDFAGRMTHRSNARLLTGVIQCSKCHRPMVGITIAKKGRKYPYYVCTERWNGKGCDQDYTRADHLEAILLEDIPTLFRDEAFMTRVWQEANERLTAEKPELETEIARVERQILKTRATVDRYFSAFEEGTLEPRLCSEKVRDLKAQIEELEAEKANLEARRAHLEIPALDRERLKTLVDHFEKVMEAGTNPQKKDLLHHWVKKVVVHGRNEVEIWYGLPHQAGYQTSAQRAPRVGLEPTTHRLTADCSAD